MKAVVLRDVVEEDIPVFFEQQQDPVASRMVAIPGGDQVDEAAFRAKWARILGDKTITKKTVLFGGSVAGNVLSFVAPWSGQREVGYWIGREYWGRGVATEALSELLRVSKARPLYARVAKTNVASVRVLEKCGFRISGSDKAACASGEEVEELVLELQAAAVTLERIAELCDADREEIRTLSLAAYPPEQFADWPGWHLDWAAAEWCVRVRDDAGTLVSYAGVHLREAERDGRPVRIGGIGGVKTHPAARGRGFAGQGIGRAVEFFGEQPGVAFALLVCEPRLLPYYSRLGWREYRGRLLVRQHDAACEFTLNRVMTRGVREEGPAGGTIDLCGPAW